MSNHGLLSKFEQLKKILVKEIESGNFKADDKFPSENVLSAKYKIGRSTVREALSSLVHEGLLYRIQGKGTFVASKKMSSKDSKTCALFIKTQGHLYETQAGVLLRDLQKNGYVTIVIDNEAMGKTEKQQVKFLRDLLNRGVTTFIIDGFYTFPANALKKIAEEVPEIIFMNRFEHDILDNAHYVLSDPANGMQQALEQLQDTGHKKIMFLTFDPATIAPAVPYENYDYKLSDHHRFTDTYQAFCDKNNIEKQIFHQDAGMDKLEELLASEDRPDAIISYLDSMAKPVFKICNKLNISIPEDIAFIGYYNTPWCEYMPKTLSSISIKEDRIAKKVASLIINKKESPKKIIIKPELIIRETC